MDNETDAQPRIDPLPSSVRSNLTLSASSQERREGRLWMAYCNILRQHPGQCEHLWVLFAAFRGGPTGLSLSEKHLGRAIS